MTSRVWAFRPLAEAVRACFRRWRADLPRLRPSTGTCAAMCDRARAAGCPHLLDVEIDDQQVLFELRTRREKGSVGPGNHAASVENQLVLTPDLIDVSNECPVAVSGRGYELFPRLRFSTSNGDPLMLTIISAPAEHCASTVRPAARCLRIC